MEIRSGTAVGPYEVIRLIGAGGMGEVYAARDPRLARLVALKILPAVVAHDADRLARFEREARAAAALNHPNILAIYDVGRVGDRPYVVCELLEGAPLRSLLDRGPVPPARAVAIGSAIASGLAAAHDRGIVHRDLKPENVFVTLDGGVKILDFGIAKLRDAASDANTLTDAGTILGTAPYMAPEQARGLTVDQRADIFALGAVMYEMLAGRRAFAGRTSADVLSAVIASDPPALAEIGVAAPQTLELVIRRCLEKEPAARFYSAHDVSLALEVFAAQSGASAGAAQRRPRLPTWIALLVGCAVGVAIAWTVVRSTADQASQRTLHFAIPIDSRAPWSPTGSALFALSPAADAIVYEDQRLGGRLRMRSFAAGTVSVLAGTDGARAPFYSPDSRWVGFFRDHTLFKTPLSGGAPTTVCPTTGEIRGASWGDDGAIVFASIAEGLWRVPAAGGAAELLLKPVKGHRYQWPFVLPGGETILFTDWQQVGFEGGTIAAYSPRTGRVTRILDRAADAEYAAGRLYFGRGVSLWSIGFDPSSLEVAADIRSEEATVGRMPTNGGTQFAVAANGSLAVTDFAEDETFTLVAVDGHRTPSDLPFARGPYFDLRASNDGTLLFADTVGDFVIFDLARGGTTRLRPGGTAWTTEMMPHWSPDGRTIVFSGGTSGGPNIWRAPADGSGRAERVTTTPANWQYLMDVGPDGTIIYAEDDPRTRLDLWVLRPGTQPRLLEQTPAFDTLARISPDGRWIAYTILAAEGPDVWVRRLDGSGPRVKASADHGTAPVWSRDGRWLFYQHGQAMMRVGWTLAGSAFRPSTPVSLFTGDYRSSSAFGADYDVLPDGRFVMLKTVPRDVSPATIDVTLVVR